MLLDVTDKPVIIHSDGRKFSGEVTRLSQRRVLAIEQADLDYIRIDYQARLQFGEIEIVIECPFVLTVDNVVRRLDPEDRNALGPFLALYPGRCRLPTYPRKPRCTSPSTAARRSWYLSTPSTKRGRSTTNAAGCLCACPARRAISPSGRLRKRLSPGWTRTTNPSVNSRMLCQLSYRGPLSRLYLRRGPRDDSSVRAVGCPIHRRPPARAASEAGWRSPHRRLGGAL